ncbi:MAG: MerR family transcriptional regulator [Pseudonocardiales bacterium]
MPGTPRLPAEANGNGPGAAELDESIEPAAARGLSVADVAGRVGVAAATLRAWERRYGLGPSARTTGGHRRYSMADIAALQRLQRLTRAGMPVASAALLALEPTSQDNLPVIDDRHGSDRLARRFAAAIDTLDPDRIARTADAVLTERGAASGWSEVFVPQLQALGRRWEATGQGVEREHLAVSVLQAALVRHTRKNTRRHSQPGARVLAAATPTEQHTLPLDALAAALAEVGIVTYVLGSLPETALHTAVADTAPAIVALWARSRQSTDLALLRGLLTRAPVVCAAGLGWRGPSLPRSVPHLPDLRTAVDAVLSWSS